ncbi:MAG: hypothetical protein HYY25_05885, partial [Candidatus Wallbacteria bacterium]|nr:hypothetical protein [Candidatus Wallbacteria bacterium]
HKSAASFRRALEQSLVLGAGLDVSGAGELQGPARLTAPPTLASERTPLSSVRGTAPTVAMGQTQGPATLLSGTYERAAGASPFSRARSRWAPIALAVGLVAAVAVGALALRRGPSAKNDTMASTALEAPSSPVKARAATADPLQALVLRLSRGELAERRRVIRDLATTQGRWVVPALCLRFTGGAHPVTGEPVERELEPLLRLEILQVLKARRDGSAVLPILLVLQTERDRGVTAVAAEAVRVLGDFDRTLRPELALEWSRLERWLRLPFGTLYEWKHGVVGPGTAMTNVQTDAEPGLDILRRKWQIAVGKFAMEYFGGREGRRLMLDGISARPQSLSAWRDITYQLFYKSRRLIDAVKIASFCWTCLPRWSEWYPPVCGKAAARAELPGIGYWLGVRSMMPTRLAPWFLAFFNAHVVPGARAIGDGAALADVAERMARELPEDPRPWMDVALFAFQWGQSPELEGLIRRYMAAPDGCFWSDAAGYFHAVLARDPAALAERVRAAGRLSTEKRVRVEPLIEQARALSKALGGRAAAVDELDARHSTLTDAPVLLWMARIYQVSGYPKAALGCLGRAVQASNLIRPAPDGTPNQVSFDESGGRPIYRLWCCLQREVGDVGGAVMTAGALVQENVPDFERYTPLLEAIRGTGPAIAPWLPTVGAMLGASSRPWAVLVRAAALLEAGQRQEAARALAQAREGFVERGGFEPLQLLALEARAAEALGRTTEAALFWGTAAAAPDAFPGEALRARARAAELTGDREAAAGYLRRAMALDPGDWDALLSIADQTRAAEGPQAAAPIYARAAVLARLSSHPAAVTIAARRARKAR